MACGTITSTLFILATTGCSLSVVLMWDIWHSAFPLRGVLLSVVVHYMMLQVEFLAAMQAPVCIGGVLILITSTTIPAHINPEVGST